MDYIYSTIEIYDKLKIKYKNYLKPEIVSIVIMQTEEDVFLETTELEIVEGGFEKQTVRRISLGFIADDEDEEDIKLFFDPKDTIENNVRKFIDDFSPYSIICTLDLFHTDACEKINNKYNTFGVDR